MDREWGSKPGSGGAASAQNHLGSYECRLCLTLHNNEGNYSARKTVKIGRPGYRMTKQFDPETKQRSLLFQIEYPEIEDLTKPRHRCMSSFEQHIQPSDKRYQYLLFLAEPYEIISFRVPSTEIDKSTPKFFSHWDPDSKMFTLQLYFKIKPPEANKPPGAPSANGGPPPLPPLGLPSGAPQPLPPIPGSLPPPPPMGNGPRPMPPRWRPSSTCLRRHDVEFHPGTADGPAHASSAGLSRSAGPGKSAAATTS